MAVNTTIFEVISTGQEFSIPGDYSADQIISSYSANVPGLGSMEHTVTVTDGVKRIVFRPRTGAKG